jgi:tRNA(Ile)-lysidine synthase
LTTIPPTTESTNGAKAGNKLSDLHERFELYLRQNRIEASRERWVLAVSGGVDSRVLLDLCAGLLPLHGTQLKVVHCNHQLRGPVGEGEKHMVAAMCRDVGIEAVCIDLDVETFATEFRLSIQEAARFLRRRALLDEAANFEATHILTAHHADDALETFLMRLLRGSGSDGLSGMRFEDGPWLKPLLFATRNEIEKHAREKGLVYIEDPSNDDLVYTRNRVRLELIPTLNQFARTDVTAVLSRTVENLRDDSEYLTHVSRLEFDRWAMITHDSVRLPHARLDQLAPALKRRLYQLAYSHLFEGRPAASALLERRHVEIIENTEREHELPGGIRVARRRADLFFSRMTAIRTQALPVVVAMPGTTTLKKFGYELITVTQPLAGEAPWRKASPFNAFVDFSQVTGPLRARPIDGRDEIYVTKDRRVNLMTYLKSQQVAKTAREHVFVVECNAGIVWVPAHCVDARFWLGSDSHIVLKMQLRPLREVTTRHPLNIG